MCHKLLIPCFTVYLLDVSQFTVSQFTQYLDIDTMFHKLLIPCFTVHLLDVSQFAVSQFT